jgi:hypothetical protein
MAFYNVEKTSRGYSVTDPDKDGEIELEHTVHFEYDDDVSIYFTKTDVEMMLRKFDPRPASEVKEGKP